MTWQATLGHRTRTAAILALMDEGCDDAEIAQRIGRSVNEVRRLKRAKGLIAQVMPVDLSPRAAGEIEEIARLRRITPQACIEQLIQRAVDQRLVEPILDGRADIAGSPA